jgi:hypothetical protein
VLPPQLPSAPTIRCGGKQATMVGTESGETLRGTPGIRDCCLGGPQRDRVTQSCEKR